MKITILKGRFTGSVNGTMVRIVCNVCSRTGESTAHAAILDSGKGEKSDLDFSGTLPGINEINLADQEITGRVGKQRKEAKSWSRIQKGLEDQRKSPNPNAMSSMIIAPVTINGRASGFQPVVCFYCKQVGLINIEPERPGTGAYGFVAQNLNEDPKVHALRRTEMTFIALRALDTLVQMNIISPAVTVVCAGASIQIQGKSSKDEFGVARQDAHQILRELSINGIPLYKLVYDTAGLSTVIKNVLVYCHAAICHLDAKYNIADGLVEKHITVEMIDLAHMILNGSLRKYSGKYDHIFGPLLWGYILARYRYAIQMALIDTDDEGIRQVLSVYLSLIREIINEQPPKFASFELEQLCKGYNGELRMV